MNNSEVVNKIVDILKDLAIISSDNMNQAYYNDLMMRIEDIKGDNEDEA